MVYPHSILYINQKVSIINKAHITFYKLISSCIYYAFLCNLTFKLIYFFLNKFWNIVD